MRKLMLFLYAEAHNVANTTGMWPQYLLDRIKDLENEPTVKEVWSYLQHKDGCRSKSFANSMMSHAPISMRTCTCGFFIGGMAAMKYGSAQELPKIMVMMIKVLVLVFTISLVAQGLLWIS